MRTSVKERFLDHCIPEPNCGCWIWLGNLTPGGYGNYRAERRYHRAHRFSYQAFKGEIPEGMYVCHRCDNRWCVNPDHLFCGNHKDNMDDCRRKGRFHSWAGSRQGIANPKAKLTAEQVATIKKLAPIPGVGPTDVARLLGTSPATIRDIWKGRTWSQEAP